MQTLPLNADIIVHAPEGGMLALVDVRNLERLTPEIATGLRRNLIVPGATDRLPEFFLIVSQAIGYLWDQKSGPMQDQSPPTIDFPMAPVVERYLPSFVDRRLGRAQLELGVAQWLWDLANGIADQSWEPERTLARTNFLRRIEGGSVTTEVGF